MIDLSVVVPAYNEENKIEESLRRIEAFLDLKGCRWELLVSSNGSKDRTDELVHSFADARPGKKIRLLPASGQEGKGAAVRLGVLAASGEYILVTDADLSAPIKEVDKLIRALEKGFDIAIGSRAIRAPGCDVRQSFKRRFMGRVFNLLVRSIVIGDFYDTQCGFKCFKRGVAHELFRRQKLDHFAFDVEILYLAKLKGLKVCEVPVMWSEGKDSRVNLIKDPLVMVKDLFYIKQTHGS